MAALEDLTPQLWTRLTPIERDWARYQFGKRLEWLGKHRGNLDEAEAQRSAVVVAFRWAGSNAVKVATLVILVGVILTFTSHGRVIQIVPGIAGLAVGGVFGGLAFARCWQIEKFLRTQGWRKRR